MTIDQLRMIDTILEVGSLSKASEKLYFSQSTLTRQINTMEKELGFQLFERSPFGISLTERGKTFYESSRSIIKIYDNAVKEALVASN